MTTVSPLQSEESRRLLDAVDKLRLLPSITHEVALPQIVVVGQQSSGKSSVLKALSNIDFPTNSGLCTQFATEIICRRDPVLGTKASVVPAAVTDAHHRRRLDGFSERWQDVVPGQDISDIIEDATQVMGLNHHRRISDDKLRLEFSGPTQDHISLIDLPGLFEQNLPDQRESDKDLVDKMVKEYISGSHTIILAVVSGAYDVQVQRIFSMFEPYRTRTLGVVTAPDMVEKGTARAATFAQLVANMSFYAGHGWHVVRGLSHSEQQDDKDRDQVEKRYFETCAASSDSVWSGIPDSRLGIGNLKAKLAILLQASIAEGLPRIRTELSDALRKCEAELTLLGTERVTTEQQREYLSDKSELLRDQIVKSLDGGHNPSSIRSLIRNANDKFADSMTTVGAYWKFYKDDQGPPEHTLTSRSYAAAGFTPPIYASENDWLRDMFNEISNSRGRELDGLIDPVWVGRIFLRQSRKWRSLAEWYAEEAFLIVEQYFNHIIETVVGCENADRFLTHAIRPELARRNILLKQKVDELLTPYSTEHLRTLNRSFRENLSDLTSVAPANNDKDTQTRNMICHYTEVMLEYYNLALNVFLDNMESLAIENVLLGGLEDIMTPAKAYRMNEEQVLELASESEDVSEKRRHLQSMIRDYEEGKKIISRYSTRGQRAVSSARQPATARPTNVLPTRLFNTANTPQTAISPSINESGAVSEVELPMPNMQTVKPCSQDGSPQHLRRRLSCRKSSYGSSVDSRSGASLGADSELSSSPPSLTSTPSRSKSSRRNRFEAVE